MEQILLVAQHITTIAAALLSIVGLIVAIYVVVLCVKFDRVLSQIKTTAHSIQQLSQLPLQVVNSLLQKLI